MQASLPLGKRAKHQPKEAKSRGKAQNNRKMCEPKAKKNTNSRVLRGLYLLLPLPAPTPCLAPSRALKF